MKQPKRRGPQRPPRPNDKGLTNARTLDVSFRPDAFTHLRRRALYETMHYRLENKGKGPVVSPGDLVRRIVDEYFATTSALPDDAVGVAVRAFLKEKEHGRTRENAAAAR